MELWKAAAFVSAVIASSLSNDAVDQAVLQRCLSACLNVFVHNTKCDVNIQYVSQTTSECGLSDRSQLVFERHLTPFTPVPITVRLWSEIAHKKTEANTGNKMVKYCFGNCNVENNSMHNWLGAGSFHFQAFNFRQSTISCFFLPPPLWFCMRSCSLCAVCMVLQFHMD